MKARLAGAAVVAVLLALIGADAVRIARNWNAIKTVRTPAGTQAPDFDLPFLDGGRVHLAENRGSVVVLAFWATWCEPCRAEMPSMDKLRGALAGKPFEVLAVNVAEPLSRIEKFVDALPLGFPLLRDRDGAVAKAWQARILPASFLVGRDGKIRYFAYGELDWSSDAVRNKVMELIR